MLKLSFVILASFWVVGCGTFLAVEGATTVMSDKTASDHLISWMSGKDCSYVRTERGLTYCAEDEVIIEPRVYCYKTLGSVSCYNEPDPRRSPDELIGRDEHNLGE